VSKILSTTAAFAILAFAATGDAQARGDNFDRGGFSPDYYQAQTQAQSHYRMRYYAGPKSPMWPAVNN
jgi:hypothetical protein